MRSDTQTVSIGRPHDRVFEFVANPANLPAWAVGFAKAVRRDGDRWVVTTGQGEVPVRIVADAGLGVVDFHLSVAPGVDGVAASRVISGGDTTEYVFTQFQFPEMPDDVFEAQVRALTHELTVLKARLEVECPL